MFIKSPQSKININLKGAIQINHNSYLVYTDVNGQTFLQNTKEDKLYKKVLQSMISANPKIKIILNKFNIKPSINIKALQELTKGHMNETCRIAEGIYSILSPHLQQEVNRSILKEASMLHDLGKVLIPSKILNKPAKLNIREREIMSIHSVLGYELLKTQSISKDTLGLIKYHHQNWKHSGYPDLEKDENLSDIGVQLISVADKYSALREARVYRNKMSRLEALLVLYKEVREGKILPEIYNALLIYAKKYDN